MKGEEAKDEQREILANAKKLIAKINKEIGHLKKETAQIKKGVASLNGASARSELVVKKCSDKMESFEESLLYILHNIKKNQFMYSHYPDDWVQNYLSLKEGLQEENQFLDTTTL